MTLQQTLASYIQNILFELYDYEVTIDFNTIQKTKKEFEGDYTFVVFPYVKAARKSPEQLATELGEKLKTKHPDFIENFNVIKGFLNLSLQDTIWLTNLTSHSSPLTSHSSPLLIEYSSPNTNKPLHLGHIRNNLLGNAVANILEACGSKVIRVNLVNDRGIHICKSMLAWMMFGNNETPESAGIKGDHLVGKYYVIFDLELKKEVAGLVSQDVSEEEALKKSQLMHRAQEMLRKWEENDPEVRGIWAQMNGWVYNGFEKTYQRLGIHFDKIY
ncbi:MAG: arginine--tRNA ligase, partial [Lentimicrobiaceae bacterium]|nr:arginine--tRNA ligase [Lentimicrobiaceae bacterium]